MRGNMNNEEYIASEEASFVRNRIIERNLQSCFELTAEQVDTVLSISNEYRKNIERKSSNKTNLIIQVAASTDKLSKQLNSISKHTKSLANELEIIEHSDPTESKSSSSYITKSEEEVFLREETDMNKFLDNLVKKIESFRPHAQ